MAIDDPDNWDYYSEISIDNPSPDYQMRLVLKRGSGTNDPANGIIYDQGNCYYDDMRDVRVGTDPDPDVAEQLPQWTESVTSGSERIMWIKTNGSSPLYIFIGNSNAQEYSDGAETWDFFLSWETDMTNNFTHLLSTNRYETEYMQMGTSFSAASGFRILHFSAITYASINRYGVGVQLGIGDGTNPPFVVANGIFTTHFVDTDYSPEDYAHGVLSRKESVTSHIYNSEYVDVIDKYNTWELLAEAGNLDVLLHDGPSNGDVLNQISSSSSIPTASLPYLHYGSHNGSTDGGRANYWEYDSVNKAIQWGAHNWGRSTIKCKNKWVAIGKYASAGPSWQVFGVWNEVHPTPPPPPPPPPPSKLSDIDVTPARVITTDFPAAAGLPKDQKIRVYAKAVSGQEKEILLDALT